MTSKHPIQILVADDDADDRLLIGDAFKEARLKNPVDYVEDGVELLEYLNRVGKYDVLKDKHLPGIILLDLNMPRMDGRTALREIRSSEVLKHIPVVILTTSQSEEDILKTYNLGVNSFITKPVTFEGLCKVISVIGEYWIQIVALPDDGEP